MASDGTARPRSPRFVDVYSISVKGVVSAGGGGGGNVPKTTLYCLEVSSASGATVWTVFKRFSELFAFAAEVRGLDVWRTDVRAEPPAFPKKRWGRGNSERVVRERRDGISAFLDELQRVATMHRPVRAALHDLVAADELHRFAFSGDLAAMRALVELEGVSVDGADACLSTPLHYAAAQGRDDVVRFLLGAGADAGAVDSFGNAPLGIARRRGHAGCASLLAAATSGGDGADGDGPAPGTSARVPPQYQTAPSERRLLVLVNPFSGTKKALRVWEGVTRPVLEAAGVEHVTVRETEHAGHAGEIAAELDLEAYDAVVCVSGDGLLHEVVNGLASRPDAALALQCPLCIVPGGSGNGLAASVGDFDALTASLRLARGLFRPLDLLRVVQAGGADGGGGGDGEPAGETRHAFLMAAWGTLADIDFESESYRWLGGARFTVEGVAKVLKRKDYQARLLYWPARGAAAVAPAPGGGGGRGGYCGDRCEVCRRVVAARSASPGDDDGKAGEPVEVVGNLSWFTACNTTHLASDSIGAPLAHRADGCLDLVMLRSAGRARLTKFLLGLDDGTFASDPESLDYVKVRAFRLEPRFDGTLFDIDGERMENRAVDVTVLPAAATLLS